MDPQRIQAIEQAVGLCYSDMGWRAPDPIPQEMVALWSLPLRSVPTEHILTSALEAIASRPADRMANGQDIRDAWLSLRSDILSAEARQRAEEQEYLNHTICKRCRGAGVLRTPKPIQLCHGDATVTCPDCGGRHQDPQPIYRGLPEYMPREYAERHRKTCLDPNCTHWAHDGDNPMAMFGKVRRGYMEKWKQDREGQPSLLRRSMEGFMGREERFEPYGPHSVLDTETGEIIVRTTDEFGAPIAPSAEGQQKGGLDKSKREFAL